MDFQKDLGDFYLRDENGKRVAEIKYSESLDDDQVWNADSTFVDQSLRGQGVAEKLVDRLVEEAERTNNKIQPKCSYVVKLFERKPDKYGHIQADTEESE